MKIISINLSKQSTIEQAIKELEAYRDSLIDKNAMFVRRLQEIGVNAAEMALAKGQGDSDKDVRFSVVMNTAEGEVEGQIIITSTPKVDKDGRVFYPHLAWEFGAGIYYNNGNANPKAKEFGMGVGTFPDQKYALYDQWWYKDENDILHLSKGTEAAMPMYKASVEIISQIEQIAREVFGG